MLQILPWSLTAAREVRVMIVCARWTHADCRVINFARYGYLSRERKRERKKEGDK